jgi:non-lysosomal glucosylceramidase
MAAQPWRAMAGPFSRADFEKLVPADKKLTPEWLGSLRARGERSVYRGEDLRKIGMPIGGLCAGQVYLGGDGRLWHWDIFNQHIGTGAEHYAKPLQPSAPFDQGFGLRVTGTEPSAFIPLDMAHWRDVSFIGEYPIGYVEYRDPGIPLTVQLEAFSPFIPLNTEDSSLPATVLRFTVRNNGPTELQIDLSGWLENSVCHISAQRRPGIRQNRSARTKELLSIECSAFEAPVRQDEGRPDIVFEDFESATYKDWTKEGTAFGNGPIEMAKIPPYQGDVAGHGNRVLNTHASAPGQTVEQRDAATGMLTSRTFSIARSYISFLIGGGAHPGKTCINLIVDGKAVSTAMGQNNNRMERVSWDVRQWSGKTAVLQIVDQETGPWGNIGIDDIVFSDRPGPPPGAMAAEPDFGTMALALLKPNGRSRVNTEISVPGDVESRANAMSKPFGQKIAGSLTHCFKLNPGASNTATFVVSWHMPNLKMGRLPPGRHYAKRFSSAVSVARYVSKNFERLLNQTRVWHDTWYDSTLPFWFLDRTFLNASILATSTSYRFGDGRFYGWEGVGCCEGTCGHVWQYAHAPARLFPDLERGTREHVDFGLALQPDGAIHFRGEFNDFPAIDAQAGTILRALREHQMAADSAFLRRTWPRIKKATEWLILKDGDGDGLIRGNQHNTLDTDWFGPVAWLSGLYLAALAAAQAMASEMGDTTFAERCGRILERGRKTLPAELFDGDYFINKPERDHLDAINSGSGCEIDQVFGQSWAFQVGLSRVLPAEETRSALKALWRYNFTPDVGPYREHYKAGRWYAMPGEAGLLMCTFPRSDWDYAQAKGKGPDWAAGYFNECMNGFEYQVAGHMIWEGLVTEGLAITRAVHDRYHPSRRNPWNEVECGDHYARSMASYGVFLAACGFEYHGPKGHLGFGPRVTADRSVAGHEFKAAFTTANGWGSYSQNSTPETLHCSIALKWGTLRLRSLAFELPENLQATKIQVIAHSRPASFEHSQDGNRIRIIFESDVNLRSNQAIEVRIGG